MAHRNERTGRRLGRRRLTSEVKAGLQVMRCMYCSQTIVYPAEHFPETCQHCGKPTTLDLSHEATP